MVQSVAQKAASTAAHFLNDLELHSKTRCTMTEATTAIWGTSGTGNPNAVRQIEIAAQLGYLKIIPHGKRTRYVEKGPKEVPADAMSQEDKDFYKRMYDEGIQAEIEFAERRIKAALATKPAEAPQVFLNEVRGLLGGKRR
jgi:hypothetical protein